MNNQTQFINMLKSIKNPKQAVLDMVKTNTNPMFKNLVQMAENNDLKGVEQFARNILKEQGRNFDDEYSQIMNLFK